MRNRLATRSEGSSYYCIRHYIHHHWMHTHLPAVVAGSKYGDESSVVSVLEPVQAARHLVRADAQRKRIVAEEALCDVRPVSIRHTSAYLSIPQHTFTYVCIRPHTRAYLCDVRAESYTVGAAVGGLGDAREVPGV